ncbi:hypothetical protein [Streptomyces sudanensis]
MSEAVTETGPRDEGLPRTAPRPAPARDAGARPPAGPGDAAGAGGDSAHQECDLVTVPARQGLEAVDILRRGAPAVGPVLHDGAGGTLGFLVPPGTAADWDVPGSACTRTDGRGLRLPADPDAPRDAAPEPPVPGGGWLLPPADADPVTDPELLREALGEAARLLRAADDCG